MARSALIKGFSAIFAIAAAGCGEPPPKPASAPRTAVTSAPDPAASALQRVNVLHELARSHVKAHQLDEARIYLEQAIETAEKLGDAHGDLLIDVLLELAGVEEAARHESGRNAALERATAVSERTHGPTAPRTRELAEELCSAYGQARLSAAIRWATVDACRERYHFTRIEKTRADTMGTLSGASPMATDPAASGSSEARPSTISSRSPSLDGAPDPIASSDVPDAADVVGTMSAGFRRCYNRAIEEDATLGGRVWLQVKIAASGDVDRVGAYVPLHFTGALVGCLVDVVFTKRFAPPRRGDATICIPLTLLRS